jgi:hypothetical protein
MKKAIFVTLLLLAGCEDVGSNPYRVTVWSEGKPVATYVSDCQPYCTSGGAVRFADRRTHRTIFVTGTVTVEPIKMGEE